MIFQVFLLKKICFSVFLLNGIADKDSRFNSGVQFHLMVPLSFPFRIQIWGTVSFFLSGFSFTKIHRTAWEGRDHLLFHSATSPHSRTLRHLNSDRLYLPDCCYSIRFTTLSNYYLIDWWCDVDFRLIASLFRFCYNYLTWETRGQ